MVSPRHRKSNNMVPCQFKQEKRSILCQSFSPGCSCYMPKLAQILEICLACPSLIINSISQLLSSEVSSSFRGSFSILAQLQEIWKFESSIDPWRAPQCSCLFLSSLKLRDPSLLTCCQLDSRSDYFSHWNYGKGYAIVLLVSRPLATEVRVYHVPRCGLVSTSMMSVGYSQSKQTYASEFNDFT